LKDHRDEAGGLSSFGVIRLKVRPPPNESHHTCNMPLGFDGECCLLAYAIGRRRDLRRPRAADPECSNREGVTRLTSCNSNAADCRLGDAFIGAREGNYSPRNHYEAPS